MSKAFRRLAVSLTASALALTWLAAPALAGVATPEDPRSVAAEGLDDIYRFVIGILVTIFVLVGGWLLYSAIRFRDTGRPDAEEPPQMHGSTRLEIGWAIVPLLILVAISGYTFVKLPDVTDVPERGEAETIGVEAFSFGWRFTYPNGETQESETLMLPVDQRFRIELTAPENDVQHNFWVPQLGPKRDAIPGQMNELWVEPTETGIYRGQCAEFCGVGHAIMLLKVKVVEQAEYDSFLAELG